MSGDECGFDANWYCPEHNAFPLQCGYAVTYAAAQLEATLAAEKRNHEDDHKAATALQAKVEELTANGDFLRESIGECHLMISRNSVEYQLKKEWEVTTLPARLAKILARVRELEGQVAWLESQERNYESCNTDLWDRLTRAEATAARVTEERELWRRAQIREEAMVVRLRGALGKAADTFADFHQALHLLQRFVLAEAARMAEEVTRAALSPQEPPP